MPSDHVIKTGFAKEEVLKDHVQVAVEEVPTIF
jgi:hypothetical protein